MIKRFGLFVLVNIAVMFTLNLLANLVFGVYFKTGLPTGQYQMLMIWCLLWGMGGAFISLLISKRMAIWGMGLRVLDPATFNSDERRLVLTVHRLAQSAGLPKMPDVAIYSSQDVNAFATGPSRSNSLVAVSTGLLSAMNHQEVEGVLAHEVSHIANGDMVTMTLLQGVLNSFVLFFSKILSRIIASNIGRQDDEGKSPSYLLMFVIEMVLQVVFGLLAGLVVSAFSRHREYRADAGGARLAGRTAMIRALQRLKAQSGVYEEAHAGDQFQNLKISGKRSGIMALFASHPPLEDRIRALETAQVL
jgi:heat shock protein HtpX